MSLPICRSAVRSSTRDPVYPCTAARVTIDNVKSMIRDNLVVDSLEPVFCNPLFTSDSNGVLLKKKSIILGPYAPNLESNRAPPIQSMNGPKILIKPPKNQLLIIPVPPVVSS